MTPRSGGRFWGKGRAGSPLSTPPPTRARPGWIARKHLSLQHAVAQTAARLLGFQDGDSELTFQNGAFGVCYARGCEGDV